MGQLMGQEAPARFAERGVSSRTEHHILSHSVGQCVHCLSRLRRPCTGMYPHPAEVPVVEADAFVPPLGPVHTNMCAAMTTAPRGLPLPEQRREECGAA